jgi:hypothetical protein
MHRTLAIISSLTVSAIVAAAAGCSSPSTSSDPCANTGTVSFSKDVIPAFQTGCTLSQSCHGQMNNVQEENLYLGENDPSMTGPTNVGMVHMGIVGVKAIENPQMDLVAAGDIDNSFLWHKIVGDQNSTDALKAGCKMATMMCSPQCTDTEPCGTQMPYNSPVLDNARMCIIKKWIQAGAKND